jgi:hypothetical protein
VSQDECKTGNCPISNANYLSLPSDNRPDKSLGLQPQCRIPRIARRMTRDANIAVISQISIAPRKRRQWALLYGPMHGRTPQESPNP